MAVDPEQEKTLTESEETSEESGATPETGEQATEEAAESSKSGSDEKKELEMKLSQMQDTINRQNSLISQWQTQPTRVPEQKTEQVDWGARLIEDPNRTVQEIVQIAAQQAAYTQQYQQQVVAGRDATLKRFTDAYPDLSGHRDADLVNEWLPGTAAAVYDEIMARGIDPRLVPEGQAFELVADKLRARLLDREKRQKTATKITTPGKVQGDTRRATRETPPDNDPDAIRRRVILERQERQMKAFGG